MLGGIRVSLALRAVGVVSGDTPSTPGTGPLRPPGGRSSWSILARRCCGRTQKGPEVRAQGPWTWSLFDLVTYSTDIFITGPSYFAFTVIPCPLFSLL